MWASGRTGWGRAPQDSVDYLIGGVSFWREGAVKEEGGGEGNGVKKRGCGSLRGGGTPELREAPSPSMGRVRERGLRSLEKTDLVEARGRS